jgi:cyclopropane-fatty-acyl-phospholipid synthase
MALMNLVAAAASIVECFPLPDSFSRAGIAVLVERTGRRLGEADPAVEHAFAIAMAQYPIALHPDDANSQHYELPTAFFARILGPRRKYSCCLYDGATTLAAAEECALEQTAARAQLQDGQRVLELGCGWGSLTLWMAEQYPHSEIVAVSNSEAQRGHIEVEATRRGLHNVRVVTADMNAFEAVTRFDRVVSVEMFEHISNWPALLGRVHSWLEPRGLLFLHVFSHRTSPYRFDGKDKADWIAQHFFTGGIMPSHGLIRELRVPFAVVADWRWSGTHYRRTAEHWLANFDANAAAIVPILREVYGNTATLWARRWRLFFLATAGLFGARGGTEWGVSHYALRPR